MMITTGEPQLRKRSTTVFLAVCVYVCPGCGWSRQGIQSLTRDP